MSKNKVDSRQAYAEDFSNFVKQNQLGRVYGGDFTKIAEYGKSFYSIMFDLPKTLDGQIRFYSTKFIYIGYKTMYDLPHQKKDGSGYRVFNTVENAKAFLKLAFVEKDFKSALEVPHITK